jgi:hypothetical protein
MRRQKRLTKEARANIAYTKYLCDRIRHDMALYGAIVWRDGEGFIDPQPIMPYSEDAPVSGDERPFDSAGS